MKRPYIQKGFLNPQDRKLGLIIDRRDREKYPTIDICWWWGWCMIYFAEADY